MAFIIKLIFLNGQIIDSFQIVHLEEHLFKWQRVDVFYKSFEEEESVWKYKALRLLCSNIRCSSNPQHKKAIV